MRTELPGPQWRQRILWFIVLWAAGLLAVGAAAMVIRFFLGL